MGLKFDLILFNFIKLKLKKKPSFLIKKLFKYNLRIKKSNIKTLTFNLNTN